jgi:transposase
MILMAELGPDLSDFRSTGALCSWAGMCPGNNESAGKKKNGRTSKGNKYLRRILGEIAQAGGVERRVTFRKSYKILKLDAATRGLLWRLAIKVLICVYHMLTKLVPYKDISVDYEA